MLQSGEHGAQIHRELQTGGPKQNARLYFQNSFHRKECKTERDKRAWTRHLYVKLQIKCTRFKGIHTFFFLCNETILKNVEKYYHIVKTMELEESRIPSWIHIVRIVRSIAYCKLCLFEAFDVTWRPKLMAQLASCVCIWFSFNSCCNSMSPNFSGWPDPESVTRVQVSFSKSPILFLIVARELWTSISFKRDRDIPTISKISIKNSRFIRRNNVSIKIKSC